MCAEICGKKTDLPDTYEYTLSYHEKQISNDDTHTYKNLVSFSFSPPTTTAKLTGVQSYRKHLPKIPQGRSELETKWLESRMLNHTEKKNLT